MSSFSSVFSDSRNHLESPFQSTLQSSPRLLQNVYLNDGLSERPPSPRIERLDALYYVGRGVLWFWHTACDSVGSGGCGRMRGEVVRSAWHIHAEGIVQRFYVCLCGASCGWWEEGGRRKTTARGAGIRHVSPGPALPHTARQLPALTSKVTIQRVRRLEYRRCHGIVF